MLEYKLYCLDDRGRIMHRHDFNATDDAEALRVADAREHPEHACEVWTLKRRLCQLPPQR